MTAPVIKTKAEQRLEYLNGLHRPLTDKESDDLRRSMHAVYEHDRRSERAHRIEAEWSGGILAEYTERDRVTLSKILKESSR